MRPLRIGNVMLTDNLILAPMAGVTNLPFRLLCAEQGAGMVCTEMISAKAIFYGNRNTEGLMEIDPGEGPVSLQLFGSDPQVVSEMAKRIEDRPFAVLDLNMGCPVPKVTSQGEGCALMKNPRLAGEIIERTARAIRKPVTVKIRKGFAAGEENAPEIAHIAEESGAAAVAVHARTREQFYSGQADWETIRRVKESVHIPVLGNGDVTNADSARRMFQQTGCDGILIGRASRGNPWIFGQISAALAGEDPPAAPTLQERKAMALRHARLLCEKKGEYAAVREMRKHLPWYFEGQPHAADWRRRVCEVETMGELRACLDTHQDAGYNAGP